MCIKTQKLNQVVLKEKVVVTCWTWYNRRAFITVMVFPQIFVIEQLV